MGADGQKNGQKNWSKKFKIALKYFQIAPII